MWLRKSRTGEYHNCLNAIVFQMLLFKMFSIHTKTQTRVFRFLRFEKLFRKAPLLWRICVAGKANRRNKAPFSNYSGVVWIGDLTNIADPISQADVSTFVATVPFLIGQQKSETIRVLVRWFAERDTKYPDFLFTSGKMCFLIGRYVYSRGRQRYVTHWCTRILHQRTGQQTGMRDIFEKWWSWLRESALNIPFVCWEGLKKKIAKSGVWFSFFGKPNILFV